MDAGRFLAGAFLADFLADTFREAPLEGHKMDSARHGALYWIDYCALTDDQLCVIWYNHGFETICEMTTVDEIPDLSAVTDEIAYSAPIRPPIPRPFGH